MNRKLRSRTAVIFSVVLALLLVVQTPMEVLAEQVDDNNGGYVEYVDSGDYMDTNTGDIGSNSGTVVYNNGHMDSNDGTVVENSGHVNDNWGTIHNNQGEVATNSGTIQANGGEVWSNDGTVEYNEAGGVIEDNSGTVGVNDGVVEQNDGEVSENASSGTIEYNNGTVKNNNGIVKNNEGTVSINNGFVQNNGVWEIGMFYIDWGDESRGIVETNYGTVLNSGIVKVNRGRVFNEGGKVISDQGEHYFKVWFHIPTGLPNNAWSYTVDKGFITYNGFDRWLEKNEVGQLTFRLHKGYGWRYDFSGSTSGDGYKVRLNSDGSLTIIVDEMYKWLANTFLILPLTQSAYADSGRVESKVVVDKSELCTLSFDLDGGAFNKGSEDEETGIVDRFVKRGDEFKFNEIPEKNGYEFKYWEEVKPEEEQTDDQVEPKRYKEGDTFIVEHDAEYKAIWEKK